MKYLQGEEFNYKKQKDIVKTMSDKELNEKYIEGEIRIITEQARYPLDTVSGMLESGKYELNPEYQRRKRWDNIQKSRLIESFIINVPIPPIFLYEVSFAKYEVMDGLQRLTAIKDYYGDLFPLEGLEEWVELNGKKYSKLPEKVREGIDRRYLSSIVLLNETAKDPKVADFLKQIVFGRLNSGGDKLVSQESRNALFPGTFNSMCIELSENENFRRMWGLPLIEKDQEFKITNEELLLESESYRKMQDVELVLRFFAYRHIDKLPSLSSQEQFLDEFLNQANNYTSETTQELKNIFLKTVDVVYKIFGEEAFYMPDGTQKKSTPTKTVYDPLMQSISKYLNRQTSLLEKADNLKENKFKDKSLLLIAGKSKNNELFDGKYNNKNNVKARIEYFDKYIESVIKNSNDSGSS